MTDRDRLRRLRQLARALQRYCFANPLDQGAHQALAKTQALITELETEDAVPR